MNGVIQRTLSVLLLGGSLFAFTGCQQLCYCFIDPCWPERYSSQARGNLNHAFAGQVNNGHVLDQTIWNYHFECGTDKLTCGGMDHLGYLARRRPEPDCKVFLQTARDVAYDGCAPEQFVTRRNELDQLRTRAVLKFLQAQTANRPVSWDVTVHDPSEVGISSPAAEKSIILRNNGFQGILPVGGYFGVGAGAAGGR